jgi:N-acyl-D-aspartate/D-glutamate deacylase
MEEAIRKLTSLPAADAPLKERGKLEPGFFADVVVFDPKNHRGQVDLRTAAISTPSVSGMCG